MIGRHRHNALPIPDRLLKVLLAEGMDAEQAEGIDLVGIQRPGFFNGVRHLWVEITLTQEKCSLG